MHTDILKSILSLYGLPQDVECSALGYAVGPCCYPSYTQQVSSANPTPSPSLPLGNHNSVSVLQKGSFVSQFTSHLRAIQYLSFRDCFLDIFMFQVHFLVGNSRGRLYLRIPIFKLKIFSLLVDSHKLGLPAQVRTDNQTGASS